MDLGRLDNENLRKINNEAALDELAKRIRTAHQGARFAATNLIEHALAAGDALLQARDAVGRGNWLAWLKHKCELSEDRAERYMRIARGRAVLDANSARVRNLSLAGALRLLKPPRSKSSAAKTTKQATSLDALGWSARQEIERYLRDELTDLARQTAAEREPPDV